MKDRTAKELLNKVVEDYDNISSDFHKTRKNDWKEFHLFLDFIKDHNSVVDLGCGNGRLYNFLRKHRKIKYTGVDNSEKLLDIAKQNFKTTFIKGDLIEIPLESKSKDVVTAIASFHHLPTKTLRKTCLKEIHRILKDDGTLIMSVWNLFQKKYKKHIWKARKKHISSLGKYGPRDTFIPWSNSGVNRYYYAFKAKELRKLLEENGFKVILEHTARNILMICKKCKKS